MPDKLPIVLGSEVPEGYGAAGIEEAPEDGETYGRMNRGWNRLQIDQPPPMDGKFYVIQNQRYVEVDLSPDPRIDDLIARVTALEGVPLRVAKRVKNQEVESESNS
ncbi:MAG TPA: hypothetical protein VNZ45_01665 [Bacteroidia bacterium]|jgi:hypothetical protein|nr:hypothetical protein [Bacteroidia bacterium]